MSVLSFIMGSKKKPLQKLPFLTICFFCLFFIITTCCLFILLLNSLVSDNEIPINTSMVKVWLTVSSVHKTMEINWFDIPNGTDKHWVGLFKIEHSKIYDKAQALHVLSEFNETEGKFTTNISFPFPLFWEETELRSKCIAFRAVYIYQNETVAESCLKTHPRWMEQSLADIENLPINQLIIPGTHDSGSNAFAFNATTSSLALKYSISQDESIFNQLVYGIRYLDIRLSYGKIKGRGERYWVVHGLLPMQLSFEDLLGEVKRFLDLTEKEIVILDIHKFEMGFDRRVVGLQTSKHRYEEVISRVMLYFDGYLALNRNGYKVKVKQLLERNQRLIVGYPKIPYLTRNLYLFPKTTHLWANTDKLSILQDYMDRNLTCTSGTSMATTIMAELTPQPLGLLIDYYKGLRHLALKVNTLLSFWMRSIRKKCVNILATDFFLGNTVIETAIEANKRKW